MTSLKSLKHGLARSTGPLLVMGLLALTGCGQQYGSRPAGLSATQAKACDDRSDAAYRAQYRGEIYRNDSYATSTKDSPFATNGMAVPPGASLGTQYGRDQALHDCYNASGSGTDTAGPAPAVAQ
jgi:hypothetical protein